jgi:hypothetical protein
MARMPSVAEVLGLVGMVAYPVCTAGLAWTVGQSVHPVAGWLVALLASAAAGLPALLRAQSAREDARNQAAYRGRADAPGAAVLVATRPHPAPQGLPHAAPVDDGAPAVAQAWPDD